MAPAPRIGAAVAYDATLGKLLLFSGVRGDSSCQAASTWILQDSWTWDGTAWAQLHPASLPPGRSFGALGYDAARGTTILFGGGAPNSDPTRFDTWTWDAKTWSQLHPSVAPAGGWITYNTDSQSLLLLADSTYAWDGRTWVNLRPAHPYPSSGIVAFMAYDAAHHAAVVLTIDPVLGATATATWTWSGTDWRQQRPVHQPSGATAIGAYDAKRGVVVALIGDQTWTWNGSDWSQQHPAHSPKPRFFASAAYDPAVGKVILFGGKIYGLAPPNTELVNNELWGWDGTDWTRAA